ncbi:MAG: tyrosine-type recombinase/integrase [Clostridia bacterium]|nr:tyrosine-type recombinase/integrase [Clostridia bacterium]
MSIRTLPLLKPLKAVPETIPVHGDHVVGNSKTPYSKPMLRIAMDRIKSIFEIDDLHPHIFRYSHATVLHELGADDKMIQHWEGHANQAATANIYIKNTQTMIDRAEAFLSDFASADA